ncbi:MarR family winged helix-turn-helix transcriptional regulator [Streptomyces sp. NBC_00199]|uniref:MarR family winged helix-turn-helix transcriptional regulator n=1 Tax=Streptomyces sp. NBC_00199 TaxID=2975678 RepID=UPI00225900E2|nr:MarR family transcriptional regulator [Streptomyces sp. NBC_00199]MCX5264637.1 MarR family transcriptional regulator [Streptomyces sp. NBC_00199]
MDTADRPGDEAARAADSPLVHDFGLLIKTATRLEQRIDSALRRECGISHTMFEVLIRLSRRRGEEVTQRLLADDLTLTSSGVTRLIDRMEEAAVARRVPSPEDRRSVLVEVTDHGRSVFLRAAEVHAQVVERYFVTPVPPGDYPRLTGSLSRIHQALRDD